MDRPKLNAAKNTGKELTIHQLTFEDGCQYDLAPDPDLQNDVEIELPKETRAVTRSTMSGKSRKTTQSGRQSQNRENVVRSRSRPMKPYETEPFLAIDNLPPDKTFVSEKTATSINAAHSRASNATPHQRSSGSGSLEAQFQRMSTYMSPYEKKTPAPPSPSVVTAQIATRQMQLESEHGASPSVKPSGRPSSRNAALFNKDTKYSASNSKENKSLNSRLEVSNKGFKIITSEEQMESDSENKMSKRSRPNTAPTSRLKLEASAKKPRPGSERVRVTSARPKSNTGSLRSRASSAGSRSGLGSRAGSRVVGLRSFGSQTGRITPANTPYRSPNKTLRPPNYHVKSPFKQTANQPDLSPDGRETPSMGMKERTALAAFHVQKMLAVAGEKDASKPGGKLKKGKLKPLYPVDVEGPKITQCRGIVSETRSYQPSPSRTLQRRINLINKIPNVHEYLYERPRTVESVHRTSIASSLDDNLDGDNLNTSRSLRDEILYTQEASILEPRAPENTFMPEPTQDEIVQGDNDVSVDPTPRMFATEISSRNVETDNRQIEISVSEPVENHKQATERDLANKNNNNIDEKDAAEQNGVNIEEPAESRSRVGSPSKSVRFVEANRNTAQSQNSKEMKEKTNENIARQQRDTDESNNLADVINADDLDESVIETVSRKNKQNSKVSCKPDKDETVCKKDDDNDEDDINKQFDSDNKDSTTQTGHSAGDANSAGKSGSDGSKSGSKEHGRNKDVGEKKEKGHQRSRSHSKDRLSVKSEDVPPSNKSKSHKPRPSSAKHDKPDLKVSDSDKRTFKTSSSSCSRFEKSKASLSHTPRLEVSSVLHGKSVSTSFRPESPKRSPTRASSPVRRSQYLFNFFSGQPCFEMTDNLMDIHNSGQKSKVKFQLEGEEPDMETIFIEDEGDVNVKCDKEITYDVLDSEIEMLRSAIQNSLLQQHDDESRDTETLEDEKNTSATEDTIQSNEEIDDESELESSASDTTVTQSEAVETIRGDYFNLLEKYRLRCMERSESYGAISTTLVTPRDTSSVTSSRSRSQKGRRVTKQPQSRGSSQKGDRQKQVDLDEKQAAGSVMLTDSGHGSIENLSEISRSTSQARSEVPRLELGGSTSDLGQDSGRSDVTLVSDDEQENEEQQGERILELVCEQLSQNQPHQKPKERREMDEDLSNLQVVATSKTLSKNSKRKNSGTSGLQATFPPLCFTINARPPRGYLYYFAYGPEMNPARFGSYIQRDVEQRFWGLLFGFNLIFSKKGTSEEAGGFANLEFNPLRSVEGCIYKITPRELQILDKCLGYPEHYQHLMLPVWMSNSSDPEALGVAQYCVPAVMYIAQNKWTQTEGSLNHDYALSQCIKSADLVTSEYKESLVAMATQQPITASA